MLSPVAAEFEGSFKGLGVPQILGMAFGAAWEVGERSRRSKPILLSSASP